MVSQSTLKSYHKTQIDQERLAPAVCFALIKYPYVNCTYIVEVQIFLVALNCTLCKKTPHSQSNNMSQGFSSFLLSFAFSQKYIRGDLIEFSNIVTWNTVLMLTKLFLKQRVFFQDLTSLVTSKYLSLNHIDNIERAVLLIWVYLHSYGSI